jgi:hypothetical protein
MLHLRLPDAPGDFMLLIPMDKEVSGIVER